MTRYHVAVLTSLLAMAVLPAASFGSGGHRDGRIAWSRIALDGPEIQIVTARPDGSALRVLTPPTEGVQDLDPKWSPDGSRILFERDLPTGRVQIVVVRANGRGERVIDTHCAAPCDSDQMPTWTPDGRHIVFTRVVGPFDRPGGSAASAVLWIADVDGTDVRRLSEPGVDGVYEDYQAHWSPDRSYIQFLRVRNEPFNSAVFRMRPNGTGVRQLTPWEIDADITDLSQARRGPTRDRVVFETYGHGGQAQNIATVPATCPTLATCTARIRYATSNAPDGLTNSINPAWSPDGSRIAFAEWTSPAPGEPDTGDWYADIFTMDPRGHHRRLVSPGAEFSFRPNWGVAPQR
jgi:Tol biopolymer transport system component